MLLPLLNFIAPEFVLKPCLTC